MNNHNLLLDFDKLKELGFVEENDGSEDPRGVDWNIRNDNFHLYIDAWGEVKLARRNPDTDYITIEVNNISELEDVVNFISD